jgi:phenylpropionate dioxygenase-like ring-hydroxylating dioxygenase large terminal subunit
VINVDPDAYRLTSDEWFSSQVAPMREELGRGGRLPDYRPTGAVREAHFHYFWPTFTVNVLPGPLNFVAFAFMPLSPSRTLTISDYFFGDDASEEQIRDQMAFGRQVGIEDQALVESIQRAAASGGLAEGRLLLSSEHLIQHFQRLVERALS